MSEGAGPGSAAPGPHVVVLSSLFPSAVQPTAGLFIRERMFRVAQQLPLVVVAPTPWFPLQGLLRRWRPGFRPGAPRAEQQQGIDVWFPRFLSVPGVWKHLDGLAMALAVWPRLRRLQREGRLDLIDAHFAYPDGDAAVRLGRWLKVPVTITLRGTEVRHAKDPALSRQVRAALHGARRIFAVSESLRRIALDLGVAPEKVLVVGNGVDLQKFHPVPRAEARRQLGLSPDVPVLITVGALVERKGFHRVIACLPKLRLQFPGLTYLVVGGSSPEGDWTAHLQQLAASLGVAEAVRFLGPVAPADLRLPLSAANVFALATRNEGWANVLLEAMACGLPVVATDVGGNAEVVCHPTLGAIVPFEDEAALQRALEAALTAQWDEAAIRGYAQQNTWDRRVAVLLREFACVATVTQARAGKPWSESRHA